MNCPAASRGVSELKRLVLLVMKLAIFRGQFLGEHHFPIFGSTDNILYKHRINFAFMDA